MENKFGGAVAILDNGSRVNIKGTVESVTVDTDGATLDAKNVKELAEALTQVADIMENGISA